MFKNSSLPEVVSRGLTAPVRVLPDFLIIGAQKSGTTSLYNYLSMHPGVITAFRKELNFFDFGFHRGSLWYKSYFPTLFYKRHKQTVLGTDKVLTGEATPQYLFHPLAPERVKKMVPNAKFIIMLRNPIDRAYSHYYHQKVRNQEELSFETALEAEPERLKGEREKAREKVKYGSSKLMSYSYLARGLYAEQVENWLTYFHADQFLILSYEDFIEKTPTVFAQVLSFLELDPFDQVKFRPFNTNNYQNLAPETREKLKAYFKPHNERLYELVGMDFGW